MITNLDRQSIDYVVSGAIGAICFYGLEEPEQRAKLCQYLAHISTPQTPVNKPPEDLPADIRLAFQDIIDYFYSNNPQRDFFLLGTLPPSLSEIQVYIGKMLQSVIFYLDNNPSPQNPDDFQNIDIAIKQILRTDYYQTKLHRKNITFEQAMDHCDKALNEDQNITVYQQIKQPVAELLTIKNKLTDSADSPERIALDQRLFLLTLLNDIEPNHYKSTGPGTRNPRQVQINAQRDEEELNFALNIQVEGRVGVNRIMLTTMLTVVCFGFFLALSVMYFTTIPGLQYSTRTRPSWPAGITDLHNSTAHLNALGDGIKFTSIQNTTFPLSSFRASDYPLLTIASLDISNHRNYANHEDLNYALEQVFNHVYTRITNGNMKFIDSYISLWAFLAEHGRHVTQQASYGINIPLTSEQAHRLRALEALRAGLEALLKEKYPELHARLSCLNYQNPTDQIGALNDLIKLEFEAQHNLFNDRTRLCYDWLTLIKNYGVYYEDYYEKSLWNTYGVSRTYSSNAAIQAIVDAMQNNNCPWWQAPLGYVIKTAGDLQNTLCAAWKNKRPTFKHVNARQKQDHRKYSYSK